MQETTAAPRYRALDFPVKRVVLRQGAPGVQYLHSDVPLDDYPPRMTDRLLHWAHHTPGRSFMAQRERLEDGSTGDWRHISYAQALEHARSIGQALLERGLNAERPVVILSENDLDHAMLALGCLYAGVPFCPVSPAYSIVSQDFEKLRHVLQTLTPGLVFARDAKRYAKAIAATVQAGTEVVYAEAAADSSDSSDSTGFTAFTPFSDLLATPATPAVDAAMQATGPDTITKFLFTSGSTKLPKAVINTQRMWCANQQQILQSMPGIQDSPPVLVDWLPWNHTFGGNKNVGMTLYNGGTLYIDDGKPTPAGIKETLRNLREIAPTLYFNVPTGFEYIAQAMQDDERLRTTLLSKVRMFFYAGAALSQSIWDSLHRTQEAHCGERIVMGTGLGMTESSPFALFITGPEVQTGDLGVPAPGLELKLVEVDGKTEGRYRGPNVTPGYWRALDATAEAFDEEVFFCTGDALRWIDPDNIHRGLRFDGRIAEDFKLATGTFVNVGPLRAKIIHAGAPYVQDAVLTGINLKEVGAMIFGTSACRTLSGLGEGASLQEVMQSAPVQAKFQQVINQLAAHATGSANRIARAVLITEPPSIDKGEITDKGSINQRAVLKHRAEMAEALHTGTLPFTLKPN